MSAIETSTAQGVLTLTLNRPAQRNAMSLQMVAELRAALQAAEADPGVRAVVLRGAGGHFCAGADVNDMAQARLQQAAGQAALDADGLDAPGQANAQFGRLCLAFARTPLPVLAVLEGTVMGGGFGLACVSDLTLAAASTVFRLPETGLGVLPAQIAPFLIERIGYAEAKRLAVCGGTVDAAEALQIRLVHEVHADGAALDAALRAALQRVLGGAPGAIAATKRLLACARFTPAEALIVEAAALFSQALQGPEGQEGTAAFLQKRAPSWAPGQ